MQDSFQRTIDYLRLSLTDRCQLRCRYCMPAEGIAFTPTEKHLTYSEIEQILTAFAKLGVKKLKLTGGEPLLHPELSQIIQFAKKKLHYESVTLTTNGVLLKKKLPALVAAGLDGVNLSLDTLDRKKYQAITRFDKLDEVLAGLKLASHYPQLTVKINVVLMEEWNRNEMLSLARLAKNDKVHVRFIEYMPIGSEKDYHAVPEKWARAELEKHFGKLVAETKRLGNGPAHYVKLPDFVGSVGFISAMSNHFCGECNRVRVTSEGFLKTCLFFDEGYSLKAAIQKHQLTATILQAISVKPEKHLFLESHVAHKEAKNMIQIGG